MDIISQSSEEMSIHAINQLGFDKANDEIVLRTLLKTSNDDHSRQIRIASLQALGMIGQPMAEAVPVLVAALKDPDEQVRRRAGRTFQAMAGAEGLILDDGWHSATEAFTEAAAEEGIPCLIDALYDSSLYVRRRAANTLGTFEAHAPNPIKAQLRKLRKEYEAFLKRKYKGDYPDRGGGR